MLIPFQDIAPETLNNLIESFILREGTDYGEIEFSLAEKTEKVLLQLKNGSVLIEFSQVSETITLIPKSEVSQLKSNY